MQAKRGIFREEPGGRPGPAFGRRRSVEEEEKKMTLEEHLKELRSRLIVTLVAFALAVVPGWFFAPWALQMLLRPAEAAQLRFVYFTPGEIFGVYLRTALVLALLISSPVIVYETLAFIWPGLRLGERAFLKRILLPGFLLLAGGMLTGYLLLLPGSLRVLSYFRLAQVEPTLSVGKYVGFVFSLILPFAFLWEYPLLVYALARVGILTPAFLRHLRRYAYVAILILAALLTPSPDPISQVLLALPLLLLYEGSIQLARWANRARERG